MGLPFRCDDSECHSNGMDFPTLGELRWNTWDCKSCGKIKYMTEAERLEHVIGIVDETVDKLTALTERVDSILAGNGGL